MKVVFLGTPEFAVPILQAVIDSSHKVVAVVTQPDRVNSRGNKKIPSPVKLLAEASNIPVFQFEKISRDGVGVIKELGADIMVTAAYGQILSEEILSICKHGVINAHGSLLPKYRGASPVQCALLNGDNEIGVTVMQTVFKVDAGDMIVKEKVVLNGTENTDECLTLLGNAGGKAVVSALDNIENGTAIFTKQDETQATYCRKFTKEDGKINFGSSAETVKNFVRAMTPWPSAYTDTPFGKLKILSARVSDNNNEGVNGEVLVADKHGFTIKCGVGAIDLWMVQGEGGKPLDYKSYLNGKSIPVGTVLE